MVNKIWEIGYWVNSDERIYLSVMTASGANGCHKSGWWNKRLVDISWQVKTICVDLLGSGFGERVFFVVGLLTKIRSCLPELMLVCCLFGR